VGYIVTIGIAVVSAPACLVAHFVVAIYYCFQQIRPGLPMGRSPAPDRA
jgi:TMEM175 potassium channel family protein